ncbi:MAG TPA: hypothetical protein VGH15_09635 [Caulobacteraceae bacterium]|jgi:hypothetical protein
MTPSNLIPALALIAVGALAAVMCFGAVPAANHDYLLILIGALAGALSTPATKTPPDKPN